MLQDFVTVFNLDYCCHTSHFLAETDHNPPLQNSYFNYLGQVLEVVDFGAVGFEAVDFEAVAPKVAPLV